MSKTKRLLSVVLCALMAVSMLTAFSFSYAAADTDFEYEVRADQTTVTAYIGEETEVTVPATLGGFPVVAIAGHAFEYSFVTKVVLPSSVTSIGNAAFKNCADLKELNIPSAVTKIGDAALMDCPSLETVTVPNSVKYIGKSFVSGCTSLKEMSVPFIGIEAGNDNFVGAWFDSESYTGNAGIPTTLKKITVTADSTVDAHAFHGMSALTDIVWSTRPTEIGAYAFYGCSALKNLSISFAGVKTVSDYAFYNCRSLQAIALPANVTEIGAYAFAKCSALKTLSAGTALQSVGTGALQDTAWLADQANGFVMLANVLYTYKGKADKSLTLPATVTAIADRALASRSDVTEVTIPSSVKYIGKEILKGSKIATLTVPHVGATASDSTFVAYFFGGNSAADNATVLPSSLKTLRITDVTVIADDLCNGAKYLQTVSVPAKTTSVGAGAFANCAALKTVEYNAVNATVNATAFENSSNITAVKFGNQVAVIPTNLCTKRYYLTSVEIPESVTSIQSRAFAGCFRIEKVKFSAVNCTSVAEDAFENCHKLVNIELGNKVTHIPANLFSNELYGGNVTDVTIPASVTSIADGAFKHSTNLKSVTYNAGNAKIGDEAFADCPKLTEIKLGKNVTSIPANLYTGNTAITSVTVPASVTSIEAEAFMNCSALETIKIENPLTKIGKDAFAETKWFGMQENGNVYIGKTFYAVKGNAGTSVKIAEGTLGIAGGAFANQNSIADVFVPNSVSVFGDDVFRGSSATMSVYSTANAARLYAAQNGVTVKLLTCADDDTYYRIVKEATASANGVREVVCADCGQVVATEEYPATDTMQGAWVQTKAPTCTEAGVKTKGSQTAAIPAKGHGITAWKVSKKATCTAEGMKVLCCEDCGKVLETKSIEKTSHTAGKWQVYKTAKTYCQGTQAILCTACGTVLNTRPIDKIALGTPAIDYTDVMSGTWYYDAVNFSLANGIFTGTSGTTFKPNDIMSRAMFVTVLGRLNGVAVKGGKTQFKDVPTGTWYTGYVKWAADNNIVNGISATSFAPNSAITREQICTIMVRYCDYAGIKLTAKQDEVFFKDMDLAGKYAVSSIMICQRAKLINGKGNGYFDPKGKATRAEVAKILQNFAVNFLAD